MKFKAFLDSKEEGQPWFFWFGAREPHRPYEYEAGHNYSNKEIFNTYPFSNPDG